MSSFLGLDFSRNVSYFAVPAAFMTALIPHMGAIIAAGPSVYDNTKPREFRDSIANSDKLTPVNKRRIDRAVCAAQNGFEHVGLYAAGVAAANHAGMDVPLLNSLSLGFVAVRAAYNVAYIFLQEDNRVWWMRSTLWQGGVAITLALWMHSGIKMFRSS